MPRAMPHQPLPPYNQIARLTTEFFLSSARVFSRHFPDRVGEAALFIDAARVCATDWIAGTDGIAPATITHRFTINSVAASLNRPFETMRRQTNKLVAAGIFHKCGAGFSLNAAEPSSIAILRYYDDMHDSFARFVEDLLLSCDLVLPDQRDDVALSAPDILLRSLDLNLLPIGMRGPLSHNWQTMIIWLAVFAANVRHITYDLQLSRAFVEATPRTEVRRPVTIKVVARALGVPYATAWRHFQALHDAGLVDRCGDGVIVTEDNIRVSQIVEPSIAIADYALRKTRELMMMGMTQGTVAEQYRSGRPQLFDLGTDSPDGR